MRAVLVSILSVLFWVSPGSFAPVALRPSSLLLSTPQGGIQKNPESCVPSPAFTSHQSPVTSYESPLFSGFAYAQDPAEVSLNAQLLAGARNGDDALVRRALDSGAAPNARNRAGDTALIIFIRKGNAPMVDLLLGKGADVNLANLDKVSPLMTAAYHGHTDIARTLINSGADVAAADQIGKNAMIYAAGQGHTEIVGLLLDAGVDVNKQYKND